MWNRISKRRALATGLLTLVGSAPFASGREPHEQPPLRIVSARTNFAAENQPPPTDEGGDRAAVPLNTAKDSRACVLLKNGNVLFGEATQLGQWVIVKRDDLSEVQLSRQEVACWGGSIRDLYQYRVDHRDSGSLAARLQDARWCLRHDLYDLAAQEMIMIYEIAPDHPEAKRIEQRLRRAAEATDAVNVAAPQPQGSAQHESVPAWVSTTLASADRLHDFAKYVQPLLINRCGQCHSHDTTRSWQLISPSVGSRPSARITHDNLQAALAFVDIHSPQASEFLIKAKTPHGGEEAGSDSRRHAAATTIGRWIETVHANVTNVTPQRSLPHETLPRNESRVPAEPAASPAAWPAAAGGHDQPAADAAATKPTVATKPERLPEISNPFDPDLFNRQFSTNP